MPEVPYRGDDELEPESVSEFATLPEALAALKEYLDTDGVIEVHSDGCDGRSNCGCGSVLFYADELVSGGKA